LEGRIAGVAAGGATLRNPAFEFQYEGDGPQAEKFR